MADENMLFFSKWSIAIKLPVKTDYDSEALCCLQGS